MIIWMRKGPYIKYDRNLGGYDGESALSMYKLHK